nr:MAG TPA: hypothetical protein [Caudoviricetes sp.]
MVCSGWARPRVKHVLTHVIARQARHARANFVTVQVGTFQNLTDQFTDLCGIVAILWDSQNWLWDGENV